MSFPNRPMNPGSSANLLLNKFSSVRLAKFSIPEESFADRLPKIQLGKIGQLSGSIGQLLQLVAAQIQLEGSASLN